MSEAWTDHLLELNHLPAEVQRDTELGPTLTGRFVVTEPLPAYSVEMSNVLVPEESTWASFANRSAHHTVISSMLKGDPEDGDAFETTAFGLPPVSATPEVGAFGRVTQFSSNVLSGQLIVGSSSSAIARGELVSLDSDRGVDAGKYRYTPLISAGEPTELASIAGEARVSVDGTPRTRLVWLTWLAGAIGAGLIAMLLQGLLAWVHRGKAE